ncbi:MAG: YbaK/EbsC family protein [Planctomycetota bacterium]|nr:MAG: YbaK/EbsC family protein [Planctomycetota bacterium]
MGVKEFLDKSKVKYKVTKHKPAFTAQQMAAEVHEPGKFVAKPVVVKVDGEYVMCVLPASYNIDLKALKKQLKAKKVEIAKEKELGKIFGDCELGAQPPFGNLYNLPTIIDKTLDEDDHILFQCGSHEKAIRLSMNDYRKLVEPKVMEFSYHVAS